LHPPPPPSPGSCGAGLIFISKVLVSLFGALFAALTVNLNNPTVVGVPEIVPPLLKFKPPGREPLSIDQDIGAVPLALSVTL